jgi:hypothetical protein
MNHSGESRGAGNQDDLSPEDRLRNELLTSGLYDLVPLAEVESVITGERLAATTAEQRDLALSAIRSLVNDGLMEFEGWSDVPLDEAMARVHLHHPLRRSGNVGIRCVAQTHRRR